MEPQLSINIRKDTNMKELKQIAKDCGLTSGQESLLYATVLRPQQDDATVLGAWDCIIGALYRRIETLEEKRDRLKETIQAMRTNAKGLRNPDAFARPDLQSQRDASAHSMEFWALRVEEEAL